MKPTAHMLPPHASGSGGIVGEGDGDAVGEGMGLLLSEGSSPPQAAKKRATTRVAKNRRRVFMMYSPRCLSMPRTGKRVSKKGFARVTARK